jgi:hypothetical protein
VADEEEDSRPRRIAARVALVMPHDGFDSGMKIEFVQQMFDVHLDSPDADIELSGNLLVA